jgi:hypothetical protein
MTATGGFLYRSGLSVFIGHQTGMGRTRSDADGRAMQGTGIHVQGEATEDQSHECGVELLKPIGSQLWFQGLVVGYHRKAAIPRRVPISRCYEHTGSCAA